MKKFFDPDTVALIGASTQPMRPGNNLFLNMKTTFGDRFFPVNPKATEIDGTPCYPSVLEVPADIDTAVIFIPARSVPDALRQCARKGITRIIIESAGFAEVGAHGIALHRESLAIAREAGMRLWGPNCMGLINVSRMKVLSFMIPWIWQGKFLPGDVSLVVQSGMLSAGFLTQMLSRSPFGLSKVCSIGNKMDVDEVDLLEYFIEDPDTRIIAMYLESMARGRRFCELARSTNKPIVVLKSGRTEFGLGAAASHTASLAQNDRVLDSALRQAGVIRTYDMHELLQVARALSLAAVKQTSGTRVAVLTFSGGAGVVSSDDLADRGMELARLSPETLARIKQVFPEWMDPMNPLDMYPAIEKTGTKETVMHCLESVFEDPGVDAIFAHMFVSPLDIPLFDYEYVAGLSKKHGKPLVLWVMGDVNSEAQAKQDLEKLGIPVVDEINKGARILAALALRK